MYLKKKQLFRKNVNIACQSREGSQSRYHSIFFFNTCMLRQPITFQSRLAIVPILRGSETAFIADWARKSMSAGHTFSTLQAITRWTHNSAQTLSARKSYAKLWNENGQCETQNVINETRKSLDQIGPASTAFSRCSVGVCRRHSHPAFLSGLGCLEVQVRRVHTECMRPPGDPCLRGRQRPLISPLHPTGLVDHGHLWQFNHNRMLYISNVALFLTSCRTAQPFSLNLVNILLCLYI